MVPDLTMLIIQAALIVNRTIPQKTSSSFLIQNYLVTGPMEELYT